MLIHVLVAQRHERYEGEHGPEALAVISEYDHEQNPDFLREQLERFRAQDEEFESLQIVDLKINQDQLMDILRPSRKPLDATVLSSGETKA